MSAHAARAHTHKFGAQPPAGRGAPARAAARQSGPAAKASDA